MIMGPCNVIAHHYITPAMCFLYMALQTLGSSISSQVFREYPLLTSRYPKAYYKNVDFKLISNDQSSLSPPIIFSIF